MKKVLKNCLYWMIFIILGFSIGLLISYFDINILLSQTNIVVLLIIFIIALILSVVVHELSHAIYFLTHGIPLRLLAFFSFVLIKVNGKWKMRFYPNKITYMGGITIPDLPAIKNEQTYNALKKNYANALIFAPIVSVSLATLAICVYIIFHVININIILVNLLLVFLFFCNLIIFFSSFIKTEIIYGDYHAYKMYKNSDDFACLQLSEYLLFSDNWRENIEKSKWLICKNVTKIAQTNLSSIKPIDTQYIDWIIKLDFLDVITPDEKIIFVITKLFNMENLLFSTPQTEERDILFYHVVFFLKKHKIVDDTSLIKKLESLSGILLSQYPSKKYYEKLSMQVFKLDDTREWLKKNINPSCSYTLLKLFDSINILEFNIIDQ